MYPSTSLAVLTPIVFITLLLAFPTIGVFAGWKRAAYWGGGNFLFYVIGLIIWKTAGYSISQSFSGALLKLLGDKAQGLDLSQLVYSIVPVLFFIIVMLAANVILVVCYYTFAKRLMKIGKYSKPKTNQEQTKVETKTVVVQTQALVQTQELTTVNAVEYAVQVKQNKKPVYKQNWFNKVVGGVGMFVLMLPITFTTTHAVAMVTTDTGTRQQNAAAKNIYNMSQGIAKNMTWFSFYNGDVNGRDFDGLFSIISLVSKKIEYKDADGKDQEGNPVKALADSIGQGVSNMTKETFKESVTLKNKESFQPLLDAMNNFTASWDSIVDMCKEDVSIILDSPGITTLLINVIEKIKATIPMTNETFEKHFWAQDSIYRKIVSAYIVGQIRLEDGTDVFFKKPNVVISVAKEPFNIIAKAIYGIYNVSELSEENQKRLLEVTSEQIQIFLNIKPN